MRIENGPEKTALKAQPFPLFLSLPPVWRHKRTDRPSTLRHGSADDFHRDVSRLDLWTIGMALG